MVECQIDNMYRYISDIKKFVDLPPRCFECRLAEMQPSQINYPDEKWSLEAIEMFKGYVDQRIIEIEVRTNQQL